MMDLNSYQPFRFAVMEEVFIFTRFKSTVWITIQHFRNLFFLAARYKHLFTCGFQHHILICNHKSLNLSASPRGFLFLLELVDKFSRSADLILTEAAMDAGVFVVVVVVLIQKNKHSHGDPVRRRPVGPGWVPELEV